MDLDSAKLHAFLSAKARKGTTVTYDDVVGHFGGGVERSAVKKRMDILTGKCVLEQTEPGVFDCSGVLQCSVEAFDSAGSQGKTNQEYVRGLKREIVRLERNNAALKETVASLKAELSSLRGAG